MSSCSGTTTLQQYEGRTPAYCASATGSSYAATQGDDNLQQRIFASANDGDPTTGVRMVRRKKILISWWPSVLKNLRPYFFY